MPEKTCALVGAGYWGKNLARNLYELGVLHTICDTNEALLDSYQDQYSGTEVTSNYKHMLQNPSITEVMIAAPAIPISMSLLRIGYSSFVAARKMRVTQGENG